MSPKTKDPSGGTTGRVKPYGRAWGGWALAPNTASMGRDNRSTDIVSRQGRSTFKRTWDFFNFFGGRFWPENYRAAGRSTSPTADLSDAMAAGG